MRKSILLFAVILMTLVLVGCSSNSMEEPPELVINIGDKVIEYISAKNNGMEVFMIEKIHLLQY